MSDARDLHLILLEKLSQDSSFDKARYLKKLESLNSDLDRINFVYDQLQSHNALPVFQPDQKCDVGATGVRQNATRFLQNDRLVDARNFYTHSLAAAESKEMLALTYASRSAVLLKEEYFEECVADINRALDLGCPRSLMTKLFARRKECLDRKKPREPNFDKPPKIKTIERNPEVHSAKNCLEVCTNKKFGRHVVATRDIKLGEVIAVERPFVSQVWHYEYWYCHECLKVCYSLIPCDNCTQVYFCGNKCKQRAAKSYHKYECPLLYTLKSIPDAVDRINFPLRMIFGRGNEEGPPEDNVYRSNRLKEVLNLHIHWDYKDMMRVLSKLALVAGAFHLVKNYTTFFENGITEDEFKLRLLKLVLICEVNKVPIQEFSIDPSSGLYEREIFGLGLYPLFGLFNHSCFENVVHTFHGTTMVYRAIRSIKKGEQLYVNYGTEYYTETKEVRQKYLVEKHFYSCTCLVCTDNWTTSSHMNSIHSKCNECKAVFQILLTIIKNASGKLANDHIPFVLSAVLKREKDFRKSSYALARATLISLYNALGNKRTY